MPRHHTFPARAALLGLLALGCREGTGPNRAPVTLAVAAGDRQIGRIDETLPLPVVFTATDRRGEPLAGVAIELAPSHGGRVAVASPVTGSDGRLVVLWTPGPAAGLQTLDATAAEASSARAIASVHGCTTPDCAPRVPPVFDLIEPLELDTYEGSGQVVHPDVVLGAGSAGPNYWLGITPYPWGDASHENPSIFTGRNGYFWQVPTGLANPIARPASGIFSDPDLVIDPTGELRIYFRQVAGGRNILLLATSTDGVRWSAPEALFDVPSHEMVSPAVVVGAPHGAWQLWAVNSGAAGCMASSTRVERRTSTDGRHWSAAAPVGLPADGEVIWHLDVQWIPARQEYWALYAVFPRGSTCATTRLRLARSPDGRNWTVHPSPVLTRGATEAFRDVVYRASFLVEPDAAAVTFWYSGARFEGGRYEWRAATEKRRVDELLEALDHES
ncbi:MAG TPA: hypothetical protein VNK43_08400, partial [Gemmatimonadales bacterium]|nr:hypothetical protein [Gemmatimonadales bacterium]